MWSYQTDNTNYELIKCILKQKNWSNISYSSQKYVDTTFFYSTLNKKPTKHCWNEVHLPLVSLYSLKLINVQLSHLGVELLCSHTFVHTVHIYSATAKSTARIFTYNRCGKSAYQQTRDLVHNVNAVVDLLALQKGVQMVEKGAEVGLAVPVGYHDGCVVPWLTVWRAVMTP